MGTDHEHRVCTYAEAEAAVRRHEFVYVGDCGCREPARDGKAKWEYCGHPVRTCMGFTKPKEASDQVDEVPRAQALEKMEDWKELGGFFRFMMDEEWVCFCCGCGCGWFRGEDGGLVTDPCAKSRYREETDLEGCTLCGDCAEVCAWQARRIVDGRMLVEGARCYGCSACEYACPEAAIAMVPRAGS